MGGLKKRGRVEVEREEGKTKVQTGARLPLSSERSRDSFPPLHSERVSENRLIIGGFLSERSSVKLMSIIAVVSRLAPIKRGGLTYVMNG